MKFEILISILLLFLISSYQSSVVQQSCMTELIYYDEYGYGFNIDCNNLSNNYTSLPKVTTNQPINLRITNSTITNATGEIFRNVSKLRILNIVNSTFTFNQSNNAFSAFTHLQHLTVQHSRFGPITSKTFSFLDDLKQISLVNINLTSLPPNFFKPMKLLESINLSFNMIHELNSIPVCQITHLKKLNLSRNNIKSLKTFQFVCSDYKDSIDIGFNQLDYKINLPKVYYDTVRTISALAELDLSYNNLMFLGHSLENLASLRYLNLEWNKLETLDSYVFNTLGNLTTLKLGHNVLGHISENTFSETVSIRSINLDDNKLSDLTLTDLKSLRDVSLSRNNFHVSNIVKWKNLPSLVYLDLSENSIYDLKPNIFKNISSLKYLNLSSNNLMLRDDSFRYLASLTQLSLGNNKLKKLPLKIFSNLRKLEHLDLSENHLTDVNVNLFKDLTNLKVLNLSFNNLKEIRKGMFDNLGNLEVLDIQGNQLKTIDFPELPEILSQLPYLKNINIKNNTFTCDFLVKFLTLLKSKEIGYNVTEEVESGVSNVDGIPCTKVQVAPVEVIRSEKNVTVASSFRKESPPEKSTALRTFMIVAAVSLTIVLLVFLGHRFYHKYYRRRKYLNDQFELISE